MLSNTNSGVPSKSELSAETSKAAMKSGTSGRLPVRCTRSLDPALPHVGLHLVAALAVTDQQQVRVRQRGRAARANASTSTSSAF